jgi:hypothetical protein
MTSSPGAADGTSERDTALARWMWAWIAIGALVVVIVIGFLIGISSALDSVDDSLAVAAGAVVDAEGDVEPLPERIASVNDSLARVDDAVQPLDRQAAEVVDTLGSIDASLVEVDGTLGDTAGTLAATDRTLETTDVSLGATHASLVDTSDVLDEVLRRARSIESTLESAESPGDDFEDPTFPSPDDQLGAQDIYVRAAEINRLRLRPILADTGDIIAALDEVNAHLTSICRSIPPVVEVGRC